MDLDIIQWTTTVSLPSPVSRVYLYLGDIAGDSVIFLFADSLRR